MKGWRSGRSGDVDNIRGPMLQCRHQAPPAIKDLAVSSALRFLAAFSMIATSPALAQPAAQSRPRMTTEDGGTDRTFQRWEHGRWQVLAGPDYCAADLDAGDMQFAIEKYWWDGVVRIQVMSSNWLSLASRSGQRAPLRLTIDGRPTWSTNSATIAGNHRTGGFFMDLEGAEARSVTARLAAGSSLDIVADGRTLGEYSLEGAVEAMEAIEACVTVMRATDDRDPFARPRR
jgi:hypothetical protein